MLYVLSLGGSVLVSNGEINTNFLKKFKLFIEKRLEKGDRFLIVVGGGSIARTYVRGASQIDRKISDFNLDYLGILATRLNAFLLKSIFKEKAYKDLVDNPKIKLKTKKPLIFSGGYQPGNSTDYVASLLAETYGVKEILVLSNIDYVYDKDPRFFKNIKKIEKINWTNFLKMFDRQWTPGLNIPFDPLASLYCQKKSKKVLLLNGHKLKNLENYLAGKKFKGTEILPEEKQETIIRA